MKIFSMNDCDWMAADTIEDATAEFIKEYGGDGSIEDPHELTDDDMDRLILHDGEGERPDCTFREGLSRMVSEGVTFPIFFASTEY